MIAPVPAVSSRRGRRWPLAAFLLACATSAVWSQPGPAPLDVTGRVVRATREGEIAVARSYVVLHRITSGSAGPLDSVRTDAQGRYRFRIVPDSGAIYLVSAQYAGIAYFSPPATPVDTGPPVVISVFDTTTADVPLHLQGRHFVVSAPDAAGVRSVIDVLEIENDTIVTRVAGTDGRPTFSLLLPEGAAKVRASQGDGSDSLVTVRDGRALLYNALSPGLRQVVLTYDLAADAFPLTLALERATGILEVLLEETTATASGGGVASQGVVNVEGRSFVRYVGQDAPAGAVLSLVVPRAAGGGGGGGDTSRWLLPFVLSLITLGTLVLVMRRGREVPAGATAGTQGSRRAADATLVGAPHDRVTELARAAAAVDALLAAAPDEPRRAVLAEYRATLKTRLRAALARQHARAAHDSLAPQDDRS